MVFELKQVLDVLIAELRSFVVAGLGLRLEGMPPGVKLVIMQIIVDVFLTHWHFLLWV